MKVLMVAMGLVPGLVTSGGRELCKQWGLPVWMRFVFLAASMAALVLLLWRVQRAATAQIARRVMLRYGWCASCGYSLEGVEFAADGCRVCPECGAAWRRSDAS
jgi:predicted RNA-binding Zn-ribbon protein involved in translation (DUF1610 family)